MHASKRALYDAKRISAKNRNPDGLREVFEIFADNEMIIFPGIFHVKRWSSDLC